MERKERKIKSSEDVQKELDKMNFFSKSLIENCYRIPEGVKADKKDENSNFGLYYDINQSSINQQNYHPNGQMYIMSEIDREYIAQYISCLEYDLKKTKKSEARTKRREQIIGNVKNIFEKNKDSDDDAR